MKPAYLLFLIAVIYCTSCSRQSTSGSLINEKASLPVAFNFDKMGLKVFASFINKKQKTMSTLYSNDIAFHNALAGTKTPTPGDVFALITWKQQPDDNWYGANIPGDLQSVEIVKTTTANNGAVNINYQRFQGKDLAIDADTLHQQERISFILNQQPSVTP